MKEMKKKSKRPDEKLVDFVNNPIVILITYIVSVISGIISLVTGDSILKNIFFIALAECSVFAVSFFIYRNFRVSKAQKRIEKKVKYNCIDKNEKLGKILHSFYHDIRNNINLFNTNRYVTEDAFKEKAKTLCNHIDVFFTELLDDDTIFVSIHLIDTGDGDSNTNYLNWKTYSFVCSDSDNNGRDNIEVYDKEPITNNTDFEIIVSTESSFKRFDFFYSRDLLQYKKEFQEKYNKVFENGNPNHEYKSTIVLPIRIKKEYASDLLSNQINNSSHYILGFLCIDSSKTYNDNKELDKDEFDVSLKYAKAFSDSLYCFFECYSVQEIHKKNKVIKENTDSNDKNSLNKNDSTDKKHTKRRKKFFGKWRTKK